MTTEDFIKAHAEAAFGSGNAKLGYFREDNFEASSRKLRHAFWEGASFTQAAAGVYIAKMASGAERVVFGK